MAYDRKIEARITEAEWKYISRKCKKRGMKSSEYIRRLIEHDIKSDDIENSLTQMDIYRQRKELIREINYIGHNINQIVKNVNSHFYTDYEKKKLFAMMQELIRLATSPVAESDSSEKELPGEVT